MVQHPKDGAGLDRLSGFSPFPALSHPFCLTLIQKPTRTGPLHSLTSTPVLPF